MAAALTRDERIAAEHLPVDDAGWTTCRYPQRVRVHPDNCVHSTHDAFYLSDRMSYAHYIEVQDEERRTAAERRFAVAVGELAGHFALSPVEVVRRLSIPSN